MKDYTVEITVQAQKQIQEIVQYIAVVLQAPDSARHLLDKLEEKIAALSVFPMRVPLTREEPWHSQGIHKMVVKDYLVYFWVDEAARNVLVTAVIHTKRNQKQQLFEAMPNF